MSALALIGARVSLGGRPALDGVDLSLRAGELVALCGPNGAGKSTAIRALAGLIRLDGGEARLGGDVVIGLPAAERARRVAYLAQERTVAWNLKAADVAALGSPPGSGPRVVAALAEMQAGALADRGINDLSGGERARVLIARALAQPASALLADEPTAGLDPDGQLLVMDRLASRATAGQAVLVSLHDLDLAARFAHRIVVLHDGRVRADAAPRQALDDKVLAAVFGVRADWIDGRPRFDRLGLRA
ncbi:MAG: ABC transporter ATP-binding protein [Alphaproteobacteria bacterium]|nr:ABC transporter ATP-binding protein [Alphaproteobacteria bacterium]MBU1525703.1 ABC transporter ATP-binding protein [Alphaproteobacteria bacterium]MBU2117667.1 ABC transporter ATP-binding protein [Alphaproteobacteria bacterium]MBU2351916.1 ABC transporter ATP-binding protein [Alphaproteobacteria bacterium]MBU2382770.1 ABC transporter ATP-binding protein [Alphaproteobacteria bacterium]